jgi:hypothetical protein
LNRSRRSRWLADQTLGITASSPRSPSALRMQAIGVVDGREAIVIEHITRLAHDAIPYVVAADPGLVSSADLPLTIPKGALASA